MAYELTTLTVVKRHLHITASTDDTLLSELITAISARIEHLCGRNFAARDYRQRIYTANHRIVLPHYPIIYVNRVAHGSANAISISHTGDNIRATAQVHDTGVRLISINSAGTQTTTDLDFATYPATGALATAISAVTGWTATAVAQAPSDDLHETAGLDALGRTVYLTYPDQDDNVYLIDHATGTLEWSHWPLWVDAPHDAAYGKVLVEYRAGYETIPDDLALLARELVASAYHMSKRDPNADSEKIGDYAVSLASRITLHEMQMAQLRPYMETR